MQNSKLGTMESKEIVVIVMNNLDIVFFQNRFIVIEHHQRKVKKEAQGKYESGNF